MSPPLPVSLLQSLDLVLYRFLPLLMPPLLLLRLPLLLPLLPFPQPPSPEGKPKSVRRR